jgi:aryl-alcohol dehydrogenase-like predicted oxidoreductase
MDSMHYRLLGRSGLRVSELCLGAMTFGEHVFRGNPFGVNYESSQALFDTFTAAGGNFIDTANVYGHGISETYLADFIASDRAHYVIASKFRMSMRQGDPNASGSHRKNMMQSIDETLRRLKTDYLDLYWVHAWDSLTPAEEMMRGLDDLVRSGKVLYLGISDAPAWGVAKSHVLAECRGWTSFAGLQIEYSLIERTPERELLPMATDLGIGITAWGPLGGAVLTGKYNQPETAADSQRLENNKVRNRLAPEKLRVVEVVGHIAQRTGHTPAQVAIAWLLARPQPIIPILGARTVAQLNDNLGALKVTLSASDLAELDTASAVPLGFPHDFLNNGLPYFDGGTREMMKGI